MGFRNKQELELYQETIKHLDEHQKKIKDFMETDEEAKKMVKAQEKEVKDSKPKVRKESINPLLAKFKKMQNK